MSLNFFNPKRTQPFIITLFMAIMAFKRVCKAMRKRLAVLHKKTHSHQLSAFRVQLKKSHNAVIQARRGKDVILPSYVQLMLEEEKYPKETEVPVIMDANVPRKVSTQKKVSRYLDDYQVKLRLGRGAPATVDRLQKSLVVNECAKPTQSAAASTKNVAKRKSTMLLSAIKAAEVTKAEDFAKSRENMHNGLTNHHHYQNHKPHGHHPDPHKNEGKDESTAGGPEEELGYEPGTSIYFGATIALQARHGGFLSYNSSEIKASAHKVLNNSRFIVKNSEDLTDVGVMKYGAALWLQAGHHDVLGAQYGTLVDQKRTIQPALVSCKRASMFKAQQYGRWIVLNRNKPMETLGQPVLHSDKVMLEQEWFFLASSSPYQSSMYKMLNNSDEAMTTKMDLFQPGDECSWKVHLVALPSDDKTGELQRQLLLQQAKESIDDSAAMRYEKGPSLLTSLLSKLPDELTDEALLSTQLSRKMHSNENQEYLLSTYKQLGAKQFHSSYNPLKFLSNIYGPQSNIVRYKAFVLERNESEVSCSMYAQSQQAQAHTGGGRGDQTSAEQEAAKSTAERLHDDYWSSAQRVLLDTKSWVQLPSAMAQYYTGDRSKKIRAAIVLQRWIRRFLNATFDFERAMKKIDQTARNKLQEKLIARRKLLQDHAHTMEIMDSSQQAERNASLKSHYSSFACSSTAAAAAAAGTGKHRGRSMPGSPNHHSGSGHQLQRAPTANRSASLNVDTHGAASPSGGGAASPSGEERRRSKSMYTMSRSQSISQINDISQIVGIADMAAIFNAAGIAINIPEIPMLMTSPKMLKKRSQSMIFAHTEVDDENEAGDEGHGAGAGAGEGRRDSNAAPHDRQGARSMMMQAHQQSRSMSSLPNLNHNLNLGLSVDTGVGRDVEREREWGHSPPSKSGKGRSSNSSSSRGSVVRMESRIDAINSFTAHLGFASTMPELTTDSSKNSNEPRLTAASQQVRPVSAGPGEPYENIASTTISTTPAPAPATAAGVGIAFQEGTPLPRGGSNTYQQHDLHLLQQQYHKHQTTGQRPHTANAAVHSSSRQAAEEAELRRQEQEQIAAREQAKAARKEELRIQTLREKRRLCRSAEKDYGLPRDIFRNPHDEASAKIGLKFLKAMSANPSIYDDIGVKKRASSATGRRQQSASSRRPPATNMW